jgi:hypothetical protein
MAEEEVLDYEAVQPLEGEAATGSTSDQPLEMGKFVNDLLLL